MDKGGDPRSSYYMFDVDNKARSVTGTPKLNTQTQHRVTLQKHACKRVEAIVEVAKERTDRGRGIWMKQIFVKT